VSSIIKFIQNYHCHWYVWILEQKYRDFNQIQNTTRKY